MINQTLIEKIALEYILPFLMEYALDGRIVIITDEFIQKNCGDIIYTANNNESITIEIKSEETEKYGNFFLETWSNRKRRTVGWMITKKCDYLFYFFIDTQNLYIINWDKLIEWSFVKGNLFNYPEKMQSKNTQLNDTWGRCVPINVIANEVGSKVFMIEKSNNYRLQQNDLFEWANKT